MSEEVSLLPTDVYLKAGIHIGTKNKTKYMSRFIYKTRNDGLSVLNLQEIDTRIALVAKFLANYSPEEIIIVSRREGSFKALKKMKEILGVQTFIGRYPPGTFTNPQLDTFVEGKVILISDPKTDYSALNDSFKAGMVSIGLCDTNNETNSLDLVIPCNNKGKKSLGLMYYLLTREYMIARKLIKNEKEFGYPIEDFVEE
ncbi:30S ribosomal protein S2 [Candidatus Woesearchaeota archaeon]|nr:30S ribosomal protein S2 [Candidatus Woesearchaeota archaeon]